MTRTDPAPDVARDATNEPDMAKARELLPCPFCGGAMMFRKALWPSDGCTDAIIHRDPVECGLTAFDSGSIDESVIAAWNSRALPPSPSPGEVVEDDPIGRAEAWLRQCSAWLLSNDLDMQCPMKADPLDIADDLARHRERFAGVDGDERPMLLPDEVELRAFCDRLYKEEDQRKLDTLIGEACAYLEAQAKALARAASAPAPITPASPPRSASRPPEESTNERLV